MAGKWKKGKKTTAALIFTEELRKRIKPGIRGNRGKTGPRTARAIAKAVGTTEVSIHQYRKDGRTPGLAMAIALANYLGINLGKIQKAAREQ